MGEDTLKKRGRLTNEQGRTVRHRGPLRQSGLGCSANSSSAEVKDIHSHLCAHTETLSSFSLGPSLVSLWTMCLSRYPTKLAGVQHGGLSPRRLGRGASQLLWVILGPGLHSAHLLLPPPLSLYRTLWVMSMSFNFQDDLLSIMQCSSTWNL